ncbi:MAG: family B DNA polymerase, partial [bacterium]
MFSIKQSFADCSQCKLLDAPSCILESNVDDFKNVDVIFIAENPGKEEVEHNPPIPLCGRAGRIFRKFFNKLFKDNFNWLLTNCVLCLTLTEDGKTGNPDKETIQRCKINCFEMIKKCNPKLIVLMGTSPKDAFGIKGQITKITGEFFEWEGYKVMTTIHPSSINQPGGKTKEPKFKESLEKAAEYLGLKFDKSENKEMFNESKTGKHLYRLSDEKFYSEDYLLIDVQHLQKERKLLYIFKDKDNNKIYHKENDDFVCYYIDDINKAKKVVPYDEVKQIKFPYHKIDSKLRNKISNELLYESDVSLEIKHTQDYYLQSKGEPDIDLNVLAVDIEVHTKGNKEFPKPEDSKYPIAMITNYEFDNGLYKVFVFDVNNENLVDKIKNDYSDKNVEIYVYKSEKEMMLDWIKEIRRDDIDILTGWYVIPFDMNYIYNRLPKLGINQSSLSKFNECYLNLYSEYFHIPGLIILDGIRLYKEFTFTKLESYSLDAVSRKEIKRGKIDSGSTFSDIFDNDINHAINYNIVDVELLYELDKKLMHIFLQNELRKICASNFKQSMTPMGRLDSLLVKFLKEKGYASKDADPSGKSNKFEGAYVHPPITGCHDWAVDFDFKSLYPSIILTYNIGVNTFIGKLKDKNLGYELFYNRENLPDKIEVILDPLFEAKEVVYDKVDLLEWIDGNDLIYTLSGCFYKQHENELSFYAEILENLLGSRDKYKKQMFDAIENKDKSLESLYDTRQQVYKILANALYGILGNNAFRFFNLDLARTITLSGQDLIRFMSNGINQ